MDVCVHRRQFLLSRVILGDSHIIQYRKRKSSHYIRKLSGYILSFYYFRNRFLNIILLLTFKQKCLKS